MVSRFLAILLVALCAAFSARAAETFHLANGDTLVGDVLLASANDAGVQVKVGEGKYDRINWAQFSQEDLKKFAKFPNMAPLVEPFIEVSQEERLKKTEVAIKQPPRLERRRRGLRSAPGTPASASASAASNDG